VSLCCATFLLMFSNNWVFLENVVDTFKTNSQLIYFTHKEKAF
jgi:hypothetical protein